MWSFGCILAELVTGRPLFPAIDENELLEFIQLRIGNLPKSMIENGRKRSRFYNFKGGNYILKPSKDSRIKNLGVGGGAHTIKAALSFCESDQDFINFIEVSSYSSTISLVLTVLYVSNV